MSYDPTSADATVKSRSLVRLIIRDTKAVLFNDYEIAGFLDLEDGSIKLAAALALDAIATDKALLLKCIKTLEVETDGAKLADALRQHADRLRQEANAGAFSVAMTRGDGYACAGSEYFAGDIFPLEWAWL